MCATRTLPTVADVFAELIARDDAGLTLQFVTLLDEIITPKLPKPSSVQDTTVATVYVNSAAIVSTVLSLISSNQHKSNPASIALVAAAQYGCPNIVAALLDSEDVEICAAMAVKAHEEACKHKHDAIIAVTYNI